MLERPPSAQDVPATLMKPVVAISAIVIAVLVTVVIEESRIKNLQDEITRLRALPPPGTTPPAPAAPPAGDEPNPADPASPPETPETTPTPPVAGLRTVPSDYPEPEQSKTQQLATGPYAQLHLELGLTNREAAYLDEVLTAQDLKMGQLGASWLQALPDDRALVESAMQDAADETMARIRHFLGSDEDFATFSAYHAMQPERELLAQVLPIIDQQGIAFELEDEQKALAALHQAREAVGGIDWSAPEAIQAIAKGEAVKRFEEEWAKQGELLKSALADFMETSEAEAFLAAREQVGALQLESVKETAAAVGGRQ